MARPNHLSRGFFPRLFGAFIGCVIGAGVVASVTLTVPLATKWTAQPLVINDGVAALASVPTNQPVAWFLPEFGYLGSHEDRTVPIASLTKMMTTYVALHIDPLSATQSGSCIAVSPWDVSQYDIMRASGQSSIPIAVGEQLCEHDLLRGVLVHSASDYAELTAELVTGEVGEKALQAFIQKMNLMASNLGLHHTHYADVAGFSPESVSTAQDQVKLASLIMQNAFVRDTVSLSYINDPHAGILQSFTPLLGVDGVVGVKSGRTDAAGGCDAMAVAYTDGRQRYLAYAVVLDARGGDLLTPAGAQALAIELSLIRHWSTHYLTSHQQVSVLRDGHGHHISLAIRQGLWLRFMGVSNRWSVKIGNLSHVRRGDVVAWLESNKGQPNQIPLVATQSISQPPWWKRLL